MNFAQIADSTGCICPDCDHAPIDLLLKTKPPKLPQYRPSLEREPYDGVRSRVLDFVLAQPERVVLSQIALALGVLPGSVANALHYLGKAHKISFTGDYGHRRYGRP